jgi:hypothetical protein
LAQKKIQTSAPAGRLRKSNKDALSSEAPFLGVTPQAKVACLIFGVIFGVIFRVFGSNTPGIDWISGPWLFFGSVCWPNRFER